MANANGSFFESWEYNKGRNGWDQPMAVPNDMSVESVNIELREGGLGKKRAGTESVAITAVTGGGIYDSAKFVPGNDPTAAEFWFTGADVGAGQKIVRVPGNAASAVQLVPVTSVSRPMSFEQLNGKFFIACPNDIAGTLQNRMLVYAPAESTTTARWAGLAPEGAPTVANTGAGAYPATPRIYRVITKRIVSGVVVSQSNPSAETSFTPSGAGTAARVTKAAATGEGETHWCVEASGTGTGDVFWQISGDIAVATTTYDDSVEPRDYPIAGLVPPPFGSNYPFPSVKYLLSDGVRLYGLGANATTTGTSVPIVNGRLYFTPALGSSDMGDDERIVDTADTSGWIDLSIGGGGIDRGLGGPINNAIAAFQSRGVYLFVPTGNADTPLKRIVLDPRIGSVAGSTIVMAEDEVGQSALYFLDPVNGPYRIGNNQSVIQWLGKDIKDLWNTVDLDSTSPELDFWGVYDSARKLVIWKVKRIGGGSFLIVFDVTNGRLVGGNEVRYGWTQWTDIAGLNTSSAVMFASAFTTPRPIAETLYIGAPSLGAGSPAATAYRSVSTLTQDGSTSYQGYVRSRAWRWNPIGRLKRLLEAVLVAKATAATTVRTRYLGNWGQQTLDQSVSVAPVGSESYVRPRPNPVMFSELQTLQVEIGDSAAANNTWELETWEGQIEKMEQNR